MEKPIILNDNFCLTSQGEIVGYLVTRGGGQLFIQKYVDGQLPFGIARIVGTVLDFAPKEPKLGDGIALHLDKDRLPGHHFSCPTSLQIQKSCKTITGLTKRVDAEHILKIIAV